jgi:hypothetical protein
MLKKLIVSTVLTVAAIASYGQGYVAFDTSQLGTSAKVFNVAGLPASGSAYLTQLFAADASGQSSTSLNPVGPFPVNFRTGTAGNTGYNQISGTTSQGNAFTASTVNVQVTTNASGPITLQMRAWTASFSTYAAAVAASAAGNPTVEFGSSPVLSNFNPYYAPNTPGVITGLQGFTMVPEPSTIALGILGASSLFFVRRRK